MQITHPYGDLNGGQWLRGNLHSHTTKSDGQRPRQAVIDDYAAHGYDFLMISDHDIYTSPEDYAGLDARGMIMIPGNEVTANGVHMLHVNADRRVEPYEDRQQVIDEINAIGNGGFAIVNHPNWLKYWDHCPQERLEQWQHYQGLEVYNGCVGRVQGSQYATDRWDRILSKGRRVWGYANDDSHEAAGDTGLGWNTTYAQEKSPSAITAALSTGRFYASTGVVISCIEVDGTRIRVETENAGRIIASTIHQRRFKVVDEPALEIDLANEDNLEGYVRFECWGHGEKVAWTQPFFLD